VAGLADAVQEAVVAQLPAMSLDRSWLAPGIYGRIWQFGLAAAKAKRGRMLILPIQKKKDAYSFIFLASSMLKILSSSPQSSIIFCNHGENSFHFWYAIQMGFIYFSKSSGDRVWTRSGPTSS